MSFGHINLAQFPECRLPQKAQSAWDDVFGDIVGAQYKPVVYKGDQEVNGVNYWYIAEQTLMTKPLVRRLVELAINEHRDEDGMAEYHLVGIQEI